VSEPKTEGRPGEQKENNMNSTAKILVVEDNASVASGLRKELLAADYEAVVASRGDQGLAQARQEPFDLVVSDVRLPGLSGLELVRQLHEVKPALPIILITAFGTADTAIEASRLGAYDYLVKPFETAEFLARVARAVGCNRFSSPPLVFEETGADQPAIVGSGLAMQRLYQEIGRAAANSLTVLLRGETGTGKELAARAIHQHGARAGRPFIAINCAAVPETLLESELFGHERGAFTGAQARRIGRFEEAALGTIFLDEIGDLNLNTQSKLLRVLQEKVIQRVGASQWIAVGARVVAATHRNLENALKEGQFREDLFYRLSALTIRLPSLVQRLEDIPELVKYFVRRSSLEMGVAAPSIQSEAVGFLQNQAWPGNVRELENVLQHARLLALAGPIGLADVEKAYACVPKPALATGQQSLADCCGQLLSRAQRGEVTNVRERVLQDLERELFSEAIALARGNQARAARWLGVTRRTMREKLACFGLRPAPGKPRP
jgi:DNA-binding NtrC family response regulator